MCNTDTQDRVLSLAIGSAATAANRFVSLLPIAGFDTIILDTGIVLNTGETIQGLSDTGAKVNVVLVGWTKQVS
jgi:predicted methyltransferase